MIRSFNCTPRARLRARCAPIDRFFAGIVHVCLLVAVASLGTLNIAHAQANPGDPLFCQPVEGTTFLIVNGGTGIFSAHGDCYGNDPSLDTDTTIPTSQGGTMTKTPGTLNYTYTPPSPTFTGLDTFPLHVLYSYNKVGGIGSAGGSAFPGTATTLTITLNVIPSSVTLAVPSTPTLITLPASAVSGCSPVGDGQNGPLPGAIYGCITAIQAGSVSPAHGTLVVSATSIQYTPTSGYTGPDTFTYRAEGVDNNGTVRLNSGDVTVHVTVSAAGGSTGAVATPALGTWMMLLLCAGMLLLGVKAAARRAA
jgi:Big-like domain-containing protein